VAYYGCEDFSVFRDPPETLFQSFLLHLFVDRHPLPGTWFGTGLDPALPIFKMCLLALYYPILKGGGR
jgi:hypothetical protein